MNGIVTEGDRKIPSLNFNPATGIFEIKGNSTPENAEMVYQPVIDLLNEYRDSPREKTIFNVNLDYFNTSSSKWLLNIFRILKQIGASGKSLEINWYYDPEDEDMQESGEDYQSILNIPFNMISKK